MEDADADDNGGLHQYAGADGGGAGRGDCEAKTVKAGKTSDGKPDTVKQNDLGCKPSGDRVLQHG